MSEYEKRARGTQPVNPPLNLAERQERMDLIYNRMKQSVRKLVIKKDSQFKKKMVENDEVTSDM